MAAKVPTMAPVQGKLKAKISFNPAEKKGTTFRAYRDDVEEDFDEFVIGYVLTEDLNAYDVADTDEKALKKYNMKIARRFIYESLCVYKGEPKLIWITLANKYAAKEITDIENKLTEWQNLSMNQSKTCEDFSAHLESLPDNLDRLSKP
jgi:anthranilate/para-aminobenzoate synthase component I